MRIRFLALALVLVLVGAACGSRTDEPSTIAAGGAATKGGAGGGGGGGGDFPKDPEAPCGPGEAATASDAGVTAEAITIATIQDIGGPVPGLFQANLDAMRAFVAYCNELGGINGRPLELLELDSRLSEHRAATQQACDSAFAIVGQAAGLDSGGAQVGVDCGIPDLPSFTAESQHAGATNVYQPLPNPPDLMAVGPQRYLKEEYGDAIESAAMFYVNAPVTELNADKRIGAYEPIGFDFKVRETTDYPQELNWGPKIEQVRSEESSYITFIGNVEGMANMLKELRTQGVEAKIIEFDAEGYQPALIEQAGPAAEGALLWVQIVPFGEADSNDEMQRYLHWLEETDAAEEPTALAVQSWSAALLFASVAKNLGDNLTREGLVAELQKVTEWDGHGIQAPANIAEQVPPECFLYLKVEGGEFVREFPDEGFECDPKGVAEVEYDFPPGAGK